MINSINLIVVKNRKIYKWELNIYIMESLDKKVIKMNPEIENSLDSEARKNFNLVSIGGLVVGTAVILGGRNIGWEGLEGFGYGVIAMDVFENVVYRGFSYLRNK